jgi:2-keto-3-deoxy-L-rhamnonate aldolase RhmA
MKTNRVKDLLRNGEMTVGAWVTIGNPDIAEMLAHKGFDWLVFDMEHGPLDIEKVQLLMQTSGGTETTGLVRVAWNDLVAIKRALDIGAAGLIIPWVNSSEDAVRAVQAARYPPRGLRGAGPRRAAMYGLDREYIAEADAWIMILVQIETTQAVESAESILKVDGVDGFFIGPRDLSVSMGLGGKRDHPDLEKAIDKVLSTGKRLGVEGGIMCHTPGEIKSAVEKGFKFIAVGADYDYLMWGADIALKAAGRG